MAHWDDITSQLLQGNEVAVTGYTKQTVSTAINRCLRVIKKEYRRMGMLCPIYSLILAQDEQVIRIRLSEVNCEVLGSSNSTQG